MKKLIVSDMDGTLLNDQQQLSERTREVLRLLTGKGVLFTAASGRSRRSLKEHFLDIPFASISDNGATIYNDKDELVWYKDIPSGMIRPLWKKVMENAFLHPVLCGLKNHYVLNSESDEAKDIARYFFNGHVEIINTIEEVFKKDVIVKLSVHTKTDGSEEKRGFELLKEFGVEFTITLSGGCWIDITHSQATKGTAYEELCSILRVRPEETMMFGDYLNDLEMLKRCPNSWCMKNGHPDAKIICRHITEYTNDEDGVARELAKCFDIEC